MGRKLKKILIFSTKNISIQFFSMFSPRDVSLEKLKIEYRPTKIIKKSLVFGSKFGFRYPVIIEKVPHNMGNYVDFSL